MVDYLVTNTNEQEKSQLYEQTIIEAAEHKDKQNPHKNSCEIPIVGIFGVANEKQRKEISPITLVFIHRDFVPFLSKA